MKILIADDDPISKRLLEATLSGWGYDVLVTSDGSEAWEAMQQPEAPGLVISDWMMPHMDGLELCRKIRQMEKTGYIYFIILTAKCLDGIQSCHDLRVADRAFPVGHQSGTASRRSWCRRFYHRLCPSGYA